jgi:hydroxyethylthiazole kinase
MQISAGEQNMAPPPGPSVADAFALYEKVRAARPLVHNITNYVAMTVAANVLLAAGASPAMLHAAEEVEEFADAANSLVINIGTLAVPWVGGMKLAAAAYRQRGKPWLLDPVAVAATRLRMAVAAELMALGPSVIRGNASEIVALAGIGQAGGRGPDTTLTAEAEAAPAQALARQKGTVVAVTGAVDYVTDGTRSIAIEGGHALMARSTALGCALSALVGAFAAVAPPFEATVAALAVYGAAGRIAASGLPGPGRLPQELCDALYRLDLAGMAGNCRLRPA